MSKMATKKVYLSGPMHNRSLSQQKNWRTSAKLLLSGIQCIDPTEMDSSGLTPEQIVKRDIAYIDFDSSVVLAWFDRPSVGTSMEVFNASLADIPVFTVNATYLEDQELPIWLVVHSTKIFPDLRSACEAIQELACD